jgi:hypothetical protein
MKTAIFLIIGVIVGYLFNEWLFGGAPFWVTIQAARFHFWLIDMFGWGMS